MVLKKRALAALSLVMTVVACSTGVNIERHAFALAEKNRANVNHIRLGQTLVEVQKIMGPPERRATAH